MADVLAVRSINDQLSYDFFSGIPESKKDFLKIASEKILHQKDFLYRQGDYQYSVFYLVEGRMITSLIGHSGKQLIMNVANPGRITIPIGKHYPHQVDCQALTDCRYLEANVRDWKKLFVIHPVLYDKVSIQQYRTISYLLSLYLSASIEDAETRLKKLLARIFCKQLLNSETDVAVRSTRINMSQEQLASGIAASREMTNKILHRMKQQGLVKISAHKIYVVNPSQLLDYLDLKP